ncbi:hypothetical protein OG426_53790 [Streptomyces canus]|uniref:hypothetical protein n=1 Tax=Streptomyces canus TaxID=58343 RepID=UPI002256B9CC|nr:hypothetical protein [Streptomyces canus]MCX4853876.1 hypothetical protein [Streptomyces canus]WSW40659.1 hypothetical protein OG426_53790 [Streptomyces canus]
MLRNVSHRRPLRLFASVLTTGLMMFGMTVAVTPSASAAACTTWNPSANGEGGGSINISTHLKNSNYSGCDNRASISAGDWVWVRCLKWNSATSHWWVYLRTEKGSNYGWTSLDNFSTIAYDDDGDGAFEYAYC